MATNNQKQLALLWAELVAKNLTNEEIVGVIHNVPELRQQAWELLLKQKPTNGDLCDLICNVPELRKQAENMLCKLRTKSEIFDEMKRLSKE